MEAPNDRPVSTICPVPRAVTGDLAIPRRRLDARATANSRAARSRVRLLRNDGDPHAAHHCRLPRRRTEQPAARRAVACGGAHQSADRAGAAADGLNGAAATPRREGRSPAIEFREEVKRATRGFRIVWKSAPSNDAGRRGTRDRLWRASISAGNCTAPDSPRRLSGRALLRPPRPSPAASTSMQGTAMFAADPHRGPLVPRA
jgi:hypothetical protein